MLDNSTTSSAWKPGRLFYIGLGVVLLANGLPFIPAWYTFIHMWRAELAASMFLAGTLIYLYMRKGSTFRIAASPDEVKFIILPILAFILWSLLSSAWAPSWKSAIHHSLIWAEFLVFYLLFRQLVQSGANFRKLLALCVFTLVYFAIPAVVEYAAYVSFGGGSTTLGMRYAKFGEPIVTILPLALLVVVRSKGKIFAIGAVAIALMWLLIFCSFGRANYLLFGCVVGAMFLWLLVSKTHRRLLPKFALLVAILVVAPLPLQVFSEFSTAPVASATSRFSDADALNSSNNFRKLMYSISTDMINANPVVGVGADNFGMQLNRYRADYGSAHPDDANLALAEDQIPSHAHNEFLQIVVELGMVGGLIILWLFAGIALIAFRAIKRLRRGSPFEIAAVLGLAMFLASSLVSAYSFRVMQNGIVFFFVLAFAAARTLKPDAEDAHAKTLASPILALAAGLIVCVGLTIYSVVRVSSAVITTQANQTQTFDEALPLYETAMRLDDENPDVRNNLGMRLFRARRYTEAVPYLEAAIMIGRAPSNELSYLASAQSLGGDDLAAEKTMAYATALYPRSPFVLTRYSIILEQNGKTAEAADVFRRAVAIDEHSANTWRALITLGPKAVSELAARDRGYLPVMDLRPQGSIYAVVTERLIKFPEERRFSFAGASMDEE